MYISHISYNYHIYTIYSCDFTIYISCTNPISKIIVFEKYFTKKTNK